MLLKAGEARFFFNFYSSSLQMLSQGEVKGVVFSLIEQMLFPPQLRRRILQLREKKYYFDGMSGMVIDRGRKNMPKRQQAVKNEYLDHHGPLSSQFYLVDSLVDQLVDVEPVFKAIFFLHSLWHLIVFDLVKLGEINLWKICVTVKLSINSRDVNTITHFLLNRFLINR